MRSELRQEKWWGGECEAGKRAHELITSVHNWGLRPFGSQVPLLGNHEERAQSSESIYSWLSPTMKGCLQDYENDPISGLLPDKGFRRLPGQQSPERLRPCFIWDTDHVHGTVHCCPEIIWTEGLWPTVTPKSLLKAENKHRNLDSHGLQEKHPQEWSWLSSQTPWPMKAGMRDGVDNRRITWMSA